MKPSPPKTTPTRTAEQTTESSGDLHEQIRRRAYELYEQRGREEGYDLRDWLQAESEVTYPNVKAVAA